jgi:phosphorylcholine metabolism protein LicD
LYTIEDKVGSKLSNGISVDIFPIEGFPSNPMFCLLAKIKNVFLVRLASWQKASFRDNGCKYKIKSLFAYLIGLICPSLKTTHGCLSALEMMYKSMNYENSKYTARSCSQRTIFRRRPLPKNVWGRPTAWEFDNTKIMLPENYDAYLNNEFYKFDYHQLPPEELRMPTHNYSERCAWWLGPTN